MAIGRNFEEAIQKAARMVSGKASAPVRMVCVGGGHCHFCEVMFKTYLSIH